mgnify:CR=1 FL=1
MTEVPGSRPKPRVKRAETRWPEVDTVYTINPDGSRNFMHPADVSGRWQNRKHLIFGLLILVYAALPLISLGGHPAVHIDIPGRRAFLFGLSFTNQDFYLMFFLVSGMGFALFVVTSLWGRLWCGFACPQTVFLEGAFRKVERWLEGPRSVRLRRNAGAWTLDKVWRKTLKHGVFLLLSAGIAHVFLAYFIPWSELRYVVVSPPSNHWAAFLWTVSWTGILYFNYSWFREQTCLVICPYGRLQSTLIDSDTLVVGYDRTRGEPRSKVSDDGGDCVDCHRCVVVCPTGIDIRNGLQMECLGCTNCIDACDEIMDKLERPRGLIRYDSQRSFDGQPRRGLIRPRSVAYAVLGLIGLAVFTVSAHHREPFEVQLLRARGLPYSMEDGNLRNLYQVRVENKTTQPRTYFLEVEPAAALGTLEIVVSQTKIRLDPLEDLAVPVVARMPRSDYRTAVPLVFSVADSASGQRRSANGRFLGPE